MVVRYLLADALSLFGNAVAGVALPWLVLVRTGDAAAAGIIAAAAALPMLLAAVVGGGVVDRFGRRRISVGADLASAASIAALPLVDAWTGLTLAWFIALGIAGALFDVPGMTAREALAPDVAAAAGVPLERLAGLREGIGGVVLIVGPAVAGGLLALLDPVTVLWTTAACSALAAAVTATLPAGVGAATGRSGFLEMGPAWAVLRGDRLLLTITLISVGAVAAIAPLQGLVLPVHLVALDSPGVLGLVITAIALGGIGGAVLYAAVGVKVARRTAFVVSLLAATAGMVVLALLPPAPLLLGAGVLVGLGMGPLSAITAVLLGERIPERVRGRVMGLQNAAVLAVAPVGMLAAGLLVVATGVRTTGMLVAGLWVLVVLAALLAPALRTLEPTEVVPGADDR
ncbi:MFS transporter [Pseudonocardia lacus]|uniref:MFS transporter n=1 Tax=Pseudonocardia lacus TaxID=2835865 RepID=UPI001BDD153B|nr:MFS transporter [Pseudonocardia lacus]